MANVVKLYHNVLCYEDLQEGDEVIITSTENDDTAFIGCHGVISNHGFGRPIVERCRNTGSCSQCPNKRFNFEIKIETEEWKTRNHYLSSCFYGVANKYGQELMSKEDELSGKDCR